MNQNRYVYDDLHERQTLSAYANYLDVLKRMGNFQLSQKITLNDLGKPKEIKAITQRCYRDMENDDSLKISNYIPKITAIEYLCLVSFQYLLYLFRKDNYDKNGNFKTTIHGSAMKLLKDCNIRFQADGEIKKDLEKIASKQIAFLNICMKNRFDAKNMIRGFHRNEHLFIASQTISLVAWEMFNDSELSRLAFFKLLAVLNFYEFEMDKFKRNIQEMDEKIEHEDYDYWNRHFQDMVENMVITKPIGILI